MLLLFSIAKKMKNMNYRSLKLIPFSDTNTIVTNYENMFWESHSYFVKTNQTHRHTRTHTECTLTQNITCQRSSSIKGLAFHHSQCEALALSANLVYLRSGSHCWLVSCVVMNETGAFVTTLLRSHYTDLPSRVWDFNPPVDVVGGWRLATLATC